MAAAGLPPSLQHVLQSMYSIAGTDENFDCIKIQIRSLARPEVPSGDQHQAKRHVAAELVRALRELPACSPSVEHRVDPADKGAYALEAFVAEYGGSAAFPPQQWIAAPRAPRLQDILMELRRGLQKTGCVAAADALVAAQQQGPPPCAPPAVGPGAPVTAARAVLQAVAPQQPVQQPQLGVVAALPQQLHPAPAQQQPVQPPSEVAALFHAAEFPGVGAGRGSQSQRAAPPPQPAAAAGSAAPPGARLAGAGAAGAASAPARDARAGSPGPAASPPRGVIGSPARRLNAGAAPFQPPAQEPPRRSGPGRGGMAVTTGGVFFAAGAASPGAGGGPLPSLLSPSPAAGAAARSPSPLSSLQSSPPRGAGGDPAPLSSAQSGHTPQHGSDHGPASDHGPPEDPDGEPERMRPWQYFYPNAAPTAPGAALPRASPGAGAFAAAAGPQLIEPDPQYMPQQPAPPPRPRVPLRRVMPGWNDDSGLPCAEVVLIRQNGVHSGMHFGADGQLQEVTDGSSAAQCGIVQFRRFILTHINGQRIRFPLPDAAIPQESLLQFALPWRCLGCKGTNGALQPVCHLCHLPAGHCFPEEPSAESPAQPAPGGAAPAPGAARRARGDASSGAAQRPPARQRPAAAPPGGRTWASVAGGREQEHQPPAGGAKLQELFPDLPPPPAPAAEDREFRVDPADGRPYTHGDFSSRYGAAEGAERWGAAGRLTEEQQGRLWERRERRRQKRAERRRRAREPQHWPPAGPQQQQQQQADDSSDEPDICCLCYDKDACIALLPCRCAASTLLCQVCLPKAIKGKSDYAPKVQVPTRGLPGPFTVPPGAACPFCRQPCWQVQWNGPRPRQG